MQKRIAHVLFVAENFVDGAGVPFCLACASENTVGHKPIGNLIHAGAFEIFSVDALYDFCLLWIDDQVSVVILGVSEEAIVVDLHLALLVAVLKSQLDVLTHGLAFLLGKARHDRDQYLALRVHRVNGFLFKIDRYVLFFQLPDVLEAVERVSGKSADGLGDDHVDIACHTFIDHSVEFVPLFCVGAGDTVICKDTCQFPFRILLNIFCVVRDLSLIACFLFFRICADAAVGCNTELFLSGLFYCISDLPSGRNHHNISH